MTFMSTTGQAPVPPAGPPGTLGPLRMTPGRWVVLAVGVPVALALIGWTGFSLITTVARGSYPFSYAIPLQDGHVAVNINAGDVTLREAPGNSTAQLTGTVQYGLIRPGISESNTPTGANIGMNCNGINTNCEMSASLDVPARTAVTLWSNGGDIDASGFTSGMTLSAGGGNMNASNLAGHLVLDTGGGDLNGSGLTGTIQISTEGGNVSAGDLNGPMRLDTGGGDLTTNGLSGTVQISTEDGNVNGTSVSSPQLTIDTGGGDVTLVFTQPPTDLNIVASDGNISLVLPPGGTKYDISTPNSASGNVSYPSSLFSSTSPDHITLNGGGGDISITQS